MPQPPRVRSRCQFFLVVEGVTGIACNVVLCVVVGLAYTLLRKHPVGVAPAIPTHFVALLLTFGVLTAFHLTWWIVGTAWVFQLGRSNPACAKDVFTFTWWFLTIGWVWYILGTIVYCILWTCVPPPKLKHRARALPASDGALKGTDHQSQSV